ncbi:hypothetical protein ACFQVC_24270 [Streptomyces monticola]|uniref:Uncharacterized protein n=1 Tax=Streptomyces monticola TaxID=2666263 RepID=A0ABW2JPK5_9ACTN
MNTDERPDGGPDERPDERPDDRPGAPDGPTWSGGPDGPTWSGGPDGPTWSGGPDGLHEPGNSPALDALLAAAGRPAPRGDIDPQALAAYRAARDSGALNAGAARTRRRDDWRPARVRGRRGSAVRAAIGALLGGLALGGVAVAGIGGPDEDPGAPADSRPGRASSAPAAPTPTPTRTGPVPEPAVTPSASAGPTASAAREPEATPGARRPAPVRPTQEVRVLCEAYEKVDGRGGALDAEALRRLTDEAAGEGAGDVAAYCDTRRRVP